MPRQGGITLWFKDEDPVSVHTLVFAAYEVFHSVSKKRNPNRRDLLFDTLWIKDEYRKDWYKIIKKPDYFFKHADRDPEGVLDFHPDMNEWFILYAVAAREFCAEQPTEELDLCPGFLSTELSNSRKAGAKRSLTPCHRTSLSMEEGCPSASFLKYSIRRDCSTLVGGTRSRNCDNAIRAFIFSASTRRPQALVSSRRIASIDLRRRALSENPRRSHTTLALAVRAWAAKAHRQLHAFDGASFRGCFRMA